MSIDEVNKKLDDLIDEWHESPEDGTSLHEFLGMTWEEYAIWVKDYQAVPERIIERMATWPNG